MLEHYYSILQATCFGYLLESLYQGNSNKYPKHMFYEEIIKHGICCISFCWLRILYNIKFILMAMSLGTNAVVVTRVHCIYNNHDVTKQKCMDCVEKWHSCVVNTSLDPSSSVMKGCADMLPFLCSCGYVDYKIRLRLMLVVHVVC